MGESSQGESRDQDPRGAVGFAGKLRGNEQIRLVEPLLGPIHQGFAKAGFVFDLEEEVADLDRGSFREILKAQREGFHGRRKAHGVGTMRAYREDFRPHMPLSGGAPLVE